MLKTLIKKQLLEIWQGYFINRKTGKARSKKGIIGFFLLFGVLLLSLGFMFYSMAGGLGAAILGNGFNWLYFALMGLLSMALGVFGSVFNTYASVYLPKDNELLLSLPIPGKTLLLARLIGVYLTSLLYSAWVWIPVMIAYWVMVPVSIGNVVFPILLIFVIALFVTVLSCLLGWVVALIAVRVKGKSFVTMLLSLAVVAVYYFVYFKVVGSISEIVSHITELGNTVKSYLRYSYLLGLAADGDGLSMLLVTAITLALAAICFLLLSRSFMKLSIAGSNGGRKAKAPAVYSEKPRGRALLHREYKLYFSLPTWMLNSGFGLLLLPIAAVVLLIKRESIASLLSQLSAALPELLPLLPVLFAAAVLLVLSTTLILPVSVSMEGKTLWQLQSLPLEPWQILHAKEKMAVQICIPPTLLFILIGGIVFGFGWWEIAMIATASLLYIGFFSDFGLYLNLKMPNFNWTNAAYLTKQSMPVVIGLFGGCGFCAVVGLGGFFLGRAIGTAAALGVYILLFLALFLLLHTWLRKKGSEIFASL